MDASETKRIAEQLRLVLSGDTWTGICAKAILADITAVQAAATYLAAARDPLAGKPMPHIYKTPADWRVPGDTSTAAWKEAVAQVQRSGEALAAAIERFDPARLGDTVPNREYSFYYLLHGVVQHTFYHLGQIMMVKKAGQG
jgi:hypothetical protein